jgi:DsbC/DsbD-like thiol-disulfide interchange protein
MRALCLLAFAPLLATADPPTRPDPVKWAIAAAPAQVKAGQFFRVTLVARIAEGWHLYSMDRKEGGPIPTTITLPGPQWFRLSGRVEPPVGITSFDEGFEMEVETYLGEAEFLLPIETLPGVKPGEVTLKFAARYQACDNRECLPPKTVQLEHPIRIIE